MTSPTAAIDAESMNRMQMGYDLEDHGGGHGGGHAMIRRLSLAFGGPPCEARNTRHAYNSVLEEELGYMGRFELGLTPTAVLLR